MLTAAKQGKLLAALKEYRKRFLSGTITELDESGTRLMINSFLSEVLGYKQLEEIKTEYMIKGTYADYVIQIDKTRHFLVEVKALSFELSDKHLRQAINYGANEGIEYALLTNGKNFEFYKIIFDKPISSRLIFSMDLSDVAILKEATDYMQHLHRESVTRSGFKPLWNKCEATDPYNIAGMLCSEPILKTIRKLVKQKYGEKCDDQVVLNAVHKIIAEKMDPVLIRPFKASRTRAPKEKKGLPEPSQESPATESETQ